ncbi:MAG: ABC transporter substrate-binding protein, partial [Bowdeniella nasicola]|nr:ABC transporter substrate-binding protein [Bowdeniella nasicola]
NDFDVQLQSAPAYSASVRTFGEISTAPFSASAYAADPQGFARNPICSGPYVLTHPYHQGDRTIELERNENYRAINTGYTRGGAGWADRLVFRIYPNEDAAYRAFDKGEVDIAALPASQFHRPHLPSDQLVKASPTQVVYLGFANREEYQNTPAYRRGWSQLIDRERLVSDVFGISGQVADGFFPPALTVTEGFANRMDQAGLEMPTCALPAYDPAAGKAALADFLASDPPALPDVIGVSGSEAGSGKANIVTAVTRAWQDGLDFDRAFPYPVDADELGDTLAMPGGVWSSFEMSYSATALAPVAMFNDPQPYARALFSRDGLAWGTNPGNFVDGGFDYQLSERFGANDDPVTRQQALNQMGAILCDQLPMLPLAYVSDVWAINTAELASAREVMTSHDGLPLLRELYRK